MIDEKTKDAICNTGRTLEKELCGFFGKIVLNYTNGKFVVANVEQSLKDNFSERPSPPSNRDSW